MGFVGFVISTFSFAMVLMGWGGAAGLSGVLGIFFFVGPVLLLLGTIFEWIMGNFFPVSASSSESGRFDFRINLPLIPGLKWEGRA
jgi:succinate-acetate transporter protein